MLADADVVECKEVSADAFESAVVINEVCVGVTRVSTNSAFANVGAAHAVSFVSDVASAAVTSVGVGKGSVGVALGTSRSIDCQLAFINVDATAVACSGKAFSNIFTNTVDIRRAVVAFVDVRTFNAAVRVTRVAFA